MMKNTVVLTSIHPPTPAAMQFAALEGWDLIVAGDLKTPRDWHGPVEAEHIMALVPEGVRAEASIRDNLYMVYANLARAALVPEKELDLLTAWLEDTAALEAG